MSGYSSDEAKTLIRSSALTGVEFQNFVRGIVSETDAVVPYAYSTFLTYSGSHTIKDVKAYEAAKILSDQLDSAGLKIARIDNTAVFELLMDGDIELEIRIKTGLTVSEFKDFWSDTNGSMWDIASDGYASNVNGWGISLTPFSTDNSVWSRSEFARLLDRTVTNDGILGFGNLSFDRVADIYDAAYDSFSGTADEKAVHAGIVARNAIDYHSFNLLFDDGNVFSDGSNLHFSNAFFAGMDPFKTLGVDFGDAPATYSRAADFLPSRSDLDTSTFNVQRYINAGKIAVVTGAIPVLGDVLDIGIRAAHASEYYEKGDNVGLAREYVGYAGNLIGGGLGVTAFWYAGPLAWFAGGYAGSEAGEIVTLGLYDNLASWFGLSKQLVPVATFPGFDELEVVDVENGIVVTDQSGDIWQSLTTDLFGNIQVVQYSSLGEPAFVLGQDAVGNLFLTSHNLDGSTTSVEITENNGWEAYYEAIDINGIVIEKGTATQNIATGIVEVQKGPTDAAGNAVGEWETRIVAINAESSAKVTRTAVTTPDGQIIGPWTTTLVSTDELLRSTGGAAFGNQIGSLFGSALGQALAGDDVFAQIGAGSVLGTTLGNIGQSIGIYLDNEDLDLLAAAEAAFGDFGDNLFSNLQSASSGAISTFLSAELGNFLDIPGDFGGQLLESYIDNQLGNLTSYVIQSIFADGVAAATSGLNMWNPGVFIGGYLARQVNAPETMAGSIGSSILGSVGAAIGLQLVATLGLGAAFTTFASTVAGILLPGIGFFVGALLGAALGDALAPFIGTVWDDWLGNNPPRTDAWVDYNPATGEFIADPEGRNSKANIRKSVVEIVGIAADLLNVYREAMGGTVINSDGELRRNFYIWTDQNDLFRGPGGNFDNPEDAINAGVLAMVKTLQIAGGDIYVKRAIAHSQATTLEELNGDLQIAQDYARYLENKDIIDLLIAADPNSAFAAGWVITLIRAQELGVTEWSASDFQGGLAAFFEALGLATLGATPEDLRVSIEGTTLKLEVVVDGETVRTIAIENFATKIGYQHLAAAANGSAVTGTAGDDVWIAANVASTFDDAATATIGHSNDILIGSAFADTINAGLGWDFVRGNAGDDLIVGGADNDSLHGDAGNDTIYGDANTGFAPIPTGTQLSDGALAGAPIAFSGARRTWVGGTEAPQEEIDHGYEPPAQNFDEDIISGGAGNDQIAGGTGEDVIAGGEGADTLHGDAGNDMLKGGAGADTVYGGAGFDTASYEDATAAVTVDLAAAAYNGTASDGDTLFDIEDLIGSKFGDTLLGDAFSNLIDGGAGADTIDGRDGRDTVSFFTHVHGVEINMAAGTAITTIPAAGGAAATAETDTLLNVEDVIGSGYDDKLIGSANGGGLDGGAGNDKIILANDDVDVSGGAGAYEVRGGDGIDTLDFSGWAKARGVQLDLSEISGGNQFSGIEKVIGSTQADRFKGGTNAEIFEGGAGHDVFDASEGRDVYLRDRGDGDDTFAQSGGRTGLNQTSLNGHVVVNGQGYYRRVHYDNQLVYGALDVEYDASSSWASDEQSEVTARGGAVVYGTNISYHDIFGGVSAVDQSALNLSHDNYFYGSTSDVGGYDNSYSSQLLTRTQLLAQLNSFDLVLGLKTSGYVSSSNFLTQISDTTRIQGGGILPVEATQDRFWVGFSSSFVASYGEVGLEPTEGGATTVYGDIATHQGTRYEFEANEAVERLGFEDSGHIELTGIKYFKDGSALGDTLAASTGQGTWLFGGALNDILTGAEKGDILVGGADNDRLQGGAGDDQYAYWLGDGHDIITDLSGADTIVFGGGITSDDVKLKIGKLGNLADHTSFREALAGEVPVDLKIEIYDPATHALVGSISIVDFQNAGNLTDKLRFAGDYELTIFEFLEKQGRQVRPTLTGTAGNDQLEGGDEGEDFYGLAGNDTLEGNGGDDIFYAHGGSDSVQGGDGSDTLDYKFATGGINVDLGGSDPDAYEADGSNDDLSSIENFAGSEYADTITGSGGVNILVGRGGNDIINAADGDDTISGGDGNDQIDAGDHDDTIFGDRGNDTINGGNNTDMLSYAGLTSAVSVNLLAGNAITSFTENGATITETDTIANIENVTGTDFNDIIVGGAVAGTYDGGMGDDRFVILNDDLDVAGGAAAATLLGGLGTDTLDFSGWAKPRGVSADLGNGRYNGIEKLVGSALDDTLKASARAETLVGGAGDDRLIGLGGADSLDGGTGIDLVDYSASAGGVSLDLSSGTGTGGDAQGDTLTGIENITGSAHGDSLSGDDGGNVLSGLAGNDLLNGKGANDTILAGAGFDRVDGGTGIDTVDYSAITGGVQVNLDAGIGIKHGGAQLGQITITGLPIGTTLSNGIQNGDGSWTLSPEQFLNATITPPANAPQSFQFSLATSTTVSGVVSARTGIIQASFTNGQLRMAVADKTESESFETGAAGWNHSTIANGGASFTNFLGRFGGSAELSKTFGLPGTQSTVTVEFDFYEIDSWDNELFEIVINGQVIASNRFDNDVADQHLYTTPLTQPQNIGFSSHPDQIHRYSVTVPVAGTTLTLLLRSSLNGSLSDESWGIDNVRITSHMPDTGAQSLAEILGIVAVDSDRLIGIENLSGTAAADSLTGDNAGNVLLGQGGNDAISGAGGDDMLRGGSGDDQYIYASGHGHDVIDDASGTDKIVLGAGITASQLVLTVGKLDDPNLPGSFRAAAASEFQLDLRIQVLDPATSAVTGSVTVLDFRNTASAADLIHFSDGSETLILALLASRGIHTQPLLLGTAGNDTLTGGAAGEVFLSLGGNNTLYGNDGDDTFFLHGGSGGVNGGNGTDTLDYQYAMGAVDVVLAGDDPDAFETTGPDHAESGLNYDLGLIENAYGSTFNDRLYGNNGVNVLLGRSGNDLINGVDGNDTLEGGDGDDQLYGDSHDDVLRGGAGNDLLDGGGQIDTMVGGIGNDTYVVDNAADVVTELAGEGTDTVQSSITHTLAANAENLTLIGSSSVNATGNALANILTGNAGNNTFDGGAGADTLIGGVGNDIYVVDASDTVTELASQGTDTVQSALSYTLGDNIEHLILIGGAGIGGTGNALANSITGNAADNTLDGALGNDTLIGAAGNDTYLVDSASDVVTEAANSGTDTVVSTVTITALAANVENLSLAGTGAISGTGNTLDNSLTGNAGNNTLNGGTGADTMIGGAGDDIYVIDNVSDVVTELAAGGLDEVQSSVTYTLSANVERLTLTGSMAINGIGNTLGNVLTGNAGVNSLTGGQGDDIYIVQNTTDLVVELAGEGIDTVQSTVAYTLGAHVENLTLTGSSSVAGTGNTLDNAITGNAGNNTLGGGAGNDALTGGAGNDTYIVDAIGDSIIELASEGTDAVQSSVTYTLAVNVENLTLTGTAAISGTGNSLANALTGNISDNTLDGGAGNDTMVGGAGNDIYLVDSTSDAVTEAANAGTDTIRTSVTLATLVGNVENLTLIGTAAINATGNTLNNVLTGNAANNTLSGGTAADTMIGNGGDDIYIVENTADIVTELASEGTDSVQSSVTYSLSANVENLTLTGSSAINAFSNALGNVIVGNSGINILTGGAGNDLLLGAGGNDQYAYALGDGHDIVTDLSGTDKLVFGTGINAAELVFRPGHLDDPANPGSFRAVVGAETPTDLRIDILDPVTRAVSGSITIVDFRNSANAADLIRYGNGAETTLQAAMQAQGVIVPVLILGTEGDDELIGGSGNDEIRGLGGDDYIVAGGGNNVIRGGAGDDWIEDDFTPGNDQYNFASGDDLDIIYDSGGTDSLRFDQGIHPIDLWFMRDEDDLVIARFGSADTVVIGAWFEAPGYQIETISVANGQNLQAGEVNSLISQMAAFAAQVGGDPWGMQAADLPPEYQVAVSAVWQAS